MDERYVTRDAKCDVGAFEFTDFTVVTITIDPNATVNATTGSAVVTGTVKCSRAGDQFGVVVDLQEQKGPKLVLGFGGVGVSLHHDRAAMERNRPTGGWHVRRRQWCCEGQDERPAQLGHIRHRVEVNQASKVGNGALGESVHTGCGLRRTATGHSTPQQPSGRLPEQSRAAWRAGAPLDSRILLNSAITSRNSRGTRERTSVAMASGTSP